MGLGRGEERPCPPGMGRPWAMAVSNGRADNRFFHQGGRRSPSLSVFPARGPGAYEWPGGPLLHLWGRCAGPHPPGDGQGGGHSSLWGLLFLR